MIIMGVALLAACTLAGQTIGEWIGALTGLKTNVGGVGIAMALLIGACEYLKGRRALDGPTSQGIAFWNAIYIPIVVAMAAQQNVYGAFTSGAVALIGGTLAVAAGFALMPLMVRIGQGSYRGEQSLPRAVVR